MISGFGEVEKPVIMGGKRGNRVFECGEKGGFGG
jgi:hypothetical protein